MSEKDYESRSYNPTTPRRRSPSYPQIGLARAIELARRVYDSAFDSQLDTNTMLQLMGYQGVSGASRSALAALKHYNLVEGRDQDLKLTKLAVKLLQPVSPQEEAEAVREAAWSPEIFQEFKSRFGERLPADAVLKAYLVREHDFIPAGADAVIGSLRETLATLDKFDRIEFAEASKEAGPGAPDDRKVEERPFVVDFSGKSRREHPSIPKEEVLSFRLSPEASAKVVFSGEVTQEAIERLIKHLELAKDSYPAQSKG